MLPLTRRRYRLEHGSLKRIEIIGYSKTGNPLQLLVMQRHKKEDEVEWNRQQTTAKKKAHYFLKLGQYPFMFRVFTPLKNKHCVIIGKGEHHVVIHQTAVNAVIQALIEYSLYCNIARPIRVRKESA